MTGLDARDVLEFGAEHDDGDEGRRKVSDRLRHEHATKPEETRHNKQERNQQNELTASVQEHRTPSLARSLEKVTRHHSKRYKRHHANEGAESFARELLHVLVVRHKRRHKRKRICHHENPRNHDERRCIEHGELERVTDTVVVLGTVIVPDNRLRARHKAHEWQNNHGDYAHEDSECGNCLVASRHTVHYRQVTSAIRCEAACKNGIQETVANLHNARREPKNKNFAHIREAELHVTAVDLDRRRLFHEELHHGKAADELAQDSRPSSALNAPVELHDEKPV